MNQLDNRIKQALDMALKDVNTGNTITDCHIEMNVQADGATQLLADALNSQAEANKRTSDAMLKLAEALKPIDICAIKLTTNNLEG